MKSSCRTPLLIVLAFIAFAGGLVPVDSPLDRIASHSAAADDQGSDSPWAKIKVELVKIFGTLMFYLAPAACAVEVAEVPRDHFVDETPATPSTLSVEIPRPPCC